MNYLYKILFYSWLLLLVTLIVASLVPLQLLVVNTQNSLELTQIYTATINYLAFGNHFNPFAFYTFKEAVHLAEVQNLFRYLQMFILLGLILISTNYKNIKYMYISWQNLFKFMAACATVIAGIGLFWNNLFELFHKLLFTNTYWQLDPQVNILINYFLPNKFLILFFIIVVAWFAMIIVVNFIAGWFYISKSKVESN